MTPRIQIQIVKSRDPDPQNNGYGSKTLLAYCLYLYQILGKLQYTQKCTVGIIYLVLDLLLKTISSP